jgi:hypothetical protein
VGQEKTLFSLSSGGGGGLCFVFCPGRKEKGMSWVGGIANLRAPQKGKNLVSLSSSCQGESSSSPFPLPILLPFQSDGEGQYNDISLKVTHFYDSQESQSS